VDGSLYVNATCDGQVVVPNVGEITTSRNGNSKLDPRQFPAEYNGLEFYFGGQAFIKEAFSGDSLFSTYTFIHGMLGVDGGDGIIPKLNDPAVRKLLADYGSNANLQAVNATTDGTITNVA
jgi:hypothetical protein